jgi:hypothetical protein
MIEGSGSGSGTIPLTSGSGSWRPKNMWVRRIRIRNTDLNNMSHGPAQPQVNLSLLRSYFSFGLELPLLFSSFSSMYHNTDHWLLLVRRKLPYTDWFSLEIHIIVTERRAQIHLFNICKYNRSHGKNLRSTPVQAVPFARYNFKHSTTCTWSRSNGSDYL